jgi:hypothetical protein
VRRAFDAYRSGGMPFSSWNNPQTPSGDTFGTFMTIAYQFMAHAEAEAKGYREPTQRMMQLFQVFDETLRARYDSRNNTPQAAAFRATMMVTAVSYAVRKDLRAEFRALNFPIDDGVYDDLLGRARQIEALTLTSALLAGCRSGTGSVALSWPAPPGGSVVTLASSHPAVAVPATVTVPAGSTAQTFPIVTQPVMSAATGSISANHGGLTRSAFLTVRPIGAAAVEVSPTSVTGGTSATGAVTLECPAAPGQIVVTLTTNRPDVAFPVPATLTIPSGSTRATFVLFTVGGGTSSQSVTLTATANGVSANTSLTVNP